MLKTRDSPASIHQPVGKVEGNAIEKPREFLYEWKQGALYELIKGRFYFAAHPDDEFTMAAIARFPERYYFSNHLPGMFAAHAPVLSLRLPLPAPCDLEDSDPLAVRQWPVAGALRFLIILSSLDATDKYEPYCQDFGPTNIALVIRFCRCAPHPHPHSCPRSASAPHPPYVVCCVTSIFRCTLKFQTLG